MQVIVVRVLTTYCEALHLYSDLPELQHRPRQPLPLRKTQTFPLPITTINEATVAGTIKIWETVYEHQLGLTCDDMKDIAVPSFNDQLTNARVRGAKITRKKDVNTFLRLDNIQLGYGVFHKCLNLVWALLKIHQGAIDQLGSLKYFFAVLEKTRLSNDKPDYHTLLTALMQILYGLVLQCWRQECGYSSLEEFAASKPTPQTLLDISLRIIQNYATPLPERPKPKAKRATKAGTNAGEGTAANNEDKENSPQPDDESNHQRELIFTGDDPQLDIANRNTRILFRDLLYVAELVRATSDGDWGRIEDILGQLTMMFRGAGSNNYSTELLHFLHNLRLVWGPDFG
jgi:hypothetical protein